MERMEKLHLCQISIEIPPLREAKINQSGKEKKKKGKPMKSKGMKKSRKIFH